VAKLRILAGIAKGRSLNTPLRGTRPSPARLRAAIFDALQGREGARFLDLYAGSGAVGLEAASRGYRVTCVERDPRAFSVLQGNARTVGCAVTVVRSDALAFVDRCEPGAFDVAFVDPPFDQDLGAIFAHVVAARTVAPRGRYHFQHPSTTDPWPQVADAFAAIGVAPERVRTRRYGSNHVLVIDVP
jgi:16S rRNA (guanine(966)-N(2))-methyltransferase RsmD